MKRTASFSLFTIAALFLTIIVPKASAEVRNSVTVNNNTGGTSCVNGKCTTTEGTGKSKVCVNGQCWDSSDGDVNYQSEDGNTKVNINTNSGDSSVSVQNKADGEQGVELPTVTPKAEKDVKGIADDHAAKAKEEAQKKAEELKKAAEAHKSAVAIFLEKQFEWVTNFLEGLFGQK